MLGYIVSLVILILFYILVLFLMPKFKNIALTNLLFCLIPFVLYVIVVIIVYSSVGFDDWNFHNVLPTANVSPFMFFIMPLCLILPKKLRQYLYTLVALLFVGMFVSPCVNSIYFASISYKFHFHFLLDYVAHFMLSLWGIYLVRTNQVNLSRKNCIVGGLIIVIVALIMLLLNVIFDTAFFGLSLNGKHNIYNQVLVSNSYLSAIIYFVGLLGVLIIGYLLQCIISRKYLINRSN